MKMGTSMMLLLSLAILCTADDQTTPFGEYKCAVELSDKYCGGGLFQLDNSGKSNAALCSPECSEVVYGDLLIDCVLKEDFWRQNIDMDLLDLFAYLEGRCTNPAAVESESSLDSEYLNLDGDFAEPSVSDEAIDMSSILEDF